MSEQQSINRGADALRVDDSEIAVDPVNLCGFLLIRWKKILIVSIAVAAMVFLAVSVAMSRSASEEDVDDGTSPEIRNAASKLTEDQKAEADEIYSRILDYEKMIEEQTRANDESYIMSLNPDSAVRYYRQYLLDTDQSDFGASYAAIVLPEDAYNEIGDLLGKGVAKGKLDEAVTIEAVAMGVINGRFNSIITVGILAPDKEKSEGIGRIVESVVNARTKLLNDQGVNASCTLMEEGYDANAKSIISDKQKARTNAVVKLVNEEAKYVTNMLAGVNDAEKTYINLLRGIASDEDDSTIKLTRKNLVLFSGAAFVGSMVICALWFVFRYMTGGKIRSVAELSVHYRIPVLQVLSGSSDSSSSKTDVITKWGRRLAGDEDHAGESLAILVEELRERAGREGLSRIYIAADRSSDTAAGYSSEISKGFFGDTTIVEGSLTLDAGGLKQLLDSDCVILLPVLNLTKRKNIRELLEICGRNDKYLMGSAPVIDWSIK